MTISVLVRALSRIAAVLFVAAAAGCATTPGVDHQDRHTAGPKDPYESVNRKVFAFNDTIDKYALKPVATGYTKVVPSPIRTGIHNFFGNFSDAWSAVNQLLQGKPKDAGTMTLRVLTNTTIGIAGLFDPATSLGFERKPEDLGLTLGHWGMEPGPYLVLPIFGASDIRDGLALPADTYVSPALLVPKFWQGVAVDAVGAVDARAGLLGASQMLDELAFDRYTFVRDAYITRRRSLVYDGNPPDLPDYDDGGDDKSAPAATGAQGALKPVPPAAPAASDAKSSSANSDGSVTMASSTGATPATPPSQPSPTPQPMPGSVTPAPMPASAPTLPIPRVGPAPTPPPPASAPHP
jgi:phospholipid-binding lipoprotein MlaA